jgi:hypothetical protein
MKGVNGAYVRDNPNPKPELTTEELYQKALDDIEFLRYANRGLKDELRISNDIRYKQHLKIVELGVPSGAY